MAEDLSVGLAAIEQCAKDRDRLENKAERELKDIAPRLIGRRVKARGGIYQISDARIGYGLRVDIRGRKVLAGTGQLGHGRWELGTLLVGNLLPEVPT